MWGSSMATCEIDISLAWSTTHGDAFVMFTVIKTDPLTAKGSCDTTQHVTGPECSTDRQDPALTETLLQ